MYSESFWISISAGAGAALMGMLWYGRSCLLTSRCVRFAFCCIKWENAPLNEKDLVQVMAQEGAPPQLQLMAPSRRVSYDGHELRAIKEEAV